MPTLYVDNQRYEVAEGQNLLHACLSLGFNLPYFCWHPAIHSVGACRQCAVKQFRDERDTRGRIVMACMTPAVDGTRISIDDPEAKAFRAGVIEWLMVNHPHDCPVCDEGGECHLQDMTVMTGHAYRRHRFPKRTYVNQYLGPFVNHEMNRCIQCYRCVRFYRDYAGGHDLAVFASHDSVYFGRASDGVLESEFSGNLVEVCPTGVFTDATLKRHYTRKWDLQTAPSICVHCGLGCNVIPGERYRTLRRIQNRYHGEVNGYFLCDRGRFGYEFVNDDRRLRFPSYRPASAAGDSTGKPAIEIGKSYVLAKLAAILSTGAGVIGIGSPRATLEANFALRALVGHEHFFAGASEAHSRLTGSVLDILRRGPVASPSLRQVEECDAIFVLGEDVTNTAPRLALALRQAIRRQPLRLAKESRIPDWEDNALREVIQDARGPLFIADVAATKLDELASATYRAAPDDLARLGFAIAAAVGGATRWDGLSSEGAVYAAAVAAAMSKAERPLIVSGISLGNGGLVHAAANIAWALSAAGRPAKLCYTTPECNSAGLGLFGAPSLEAAFRAVREGRAATVVILENDLYRRADASAVDAFLAAAGHVIALDSVPSETTARAEIALPCATFAESDGTLVNNEGRAQRFYQVFVPQGEIQESWRWLRDMMVASGRLDAARWETLDDVAAALGEALPALKPISGIAPRASFRLAGMKIPRQSKRTSGRTAIYANIDVSEPKPPDDPDSALSFSMEGFEGQPPPALIPRFWAPGWNSPQAVNKFQSEIGGSLRGGDPGLRLIEPAQSGQPNPFTEAPEAFRPRDGELLLIPMYHVFGSEELSILAPGIAELAPRAYLALSPADAKRLGLRADEAAFLTLGGSTRRLDVKVLPSLTPGLAGIPAGLPGLLGIDLPVWSGLPRQEGTT